MAASVSHLLASLCAVRVALARSVPMVISSGSFLERVVARDGAVPHSLIIFGRAPSSVVAATVIRLDYQLNTSHVALAGTVLPNW